MFDFRHVWETPIEDLIDEAKTKWKKKHHPVQYVTEQYVNNLDLNESTDYESVTKTLLHLSTAEKNYSANNMTPSLLRKGLGILGSLLSIFAITHAEEFDTFPTKAWPFAFKERDNND